MSAASLDSAVPGGVGSQRLARAASWTLGVLFWVILPIACLVLVGTGIASFVRHVNNTPSGVRGTFQVTSHRCVNNICITGGVFVSDDQRLRETDLIGDYRWHIGQTHPAIYEPSAIDVIPLPSKWDPTPTVTGLAGAALFLGVWSWALAAGRRERRAGVPARTEFPQPTRG